MKINEITRSVELVSAKGKKKPENSTLYKIVDLEKIYKSIDAFFISYFTLDENECLTALAITTLNNELIRMENISHKKGLITIIILSILHNEKQLKIRPSEDLTPEGLRWLLHSIQLNKYFSITDYNNRPISKEELNNDWFNYGGKIGIILSSKNALNEAIDKNLSKSIGLLMPMIKWLGNEDLF
jgi:hypothetical protein